MRSHLILSLKSNEKIIAVIPAYNESGKIGTVVSKILEEQIVDEILVIDDGSKDLTQQEAEKSGAKVIKHDKNFGGLSALNNINFNLSPGEIVSLIGPNGSGKTTFFNLLTGIIQPSFGEIYFSGEQINHYPPHWITARGIARTFQNIRLFSNMTALENVMVGRHCRTRNEVISALLRTKSFYKEEKLIQKSALEMLTFIGLISQANELAKNMAYGNQRKLEIARALVTEPKLLLLDEPTAGMNPKESLEIIELINKIRSQGISIFLIEHQMKVVMEISDRVIVLDHGEKIAEGSPKEIQNNPQVIEAYLGVVKK